jgi:hypothetical protein
LVALYSHFVGKSACVSLDAASISSDSDIDSDDINSGELEVMVLDSDVVILSDSEPCDGAVAVRSIPDSCNTAGLPDISPKAADHRLQCPSVDVQGPPPDSNEVVSQGPIKTKEDKKRLKAALKEALERHFLYLFPHQQSF